MARGEHDAEIRVERPGEVSDSGRRDHAEAEYVDPGTRQARDDSRFEEIAGSPGVTSDDSDGAAPMTRNGRDRCQYWHGRDR